MYTLTYSSWRCCCTVYRTLCVGCLLMYVHMYVHMPMFAPAHSLPVDTLLTALMCVQHVQHTVASPLTHSLRACTVHLLGWCHHYLSLHFLTAGHIVGKSYFKHPAIQMSMSSLDRVVRASAASPAAGCIWRILCITVRAYGV